MRLRLQTQGEPLDIELEENSETIAVNWSHTYALQDKQFVLTRYDDRSTMELATAPTQQIHAASEDTGNA